MMCKYSEKPWLIPFLYFSVEYKDVAKEFRQYEKMIMAQNQIAYSFQQEW